MIVIVLEFESEPHLLTSAAIPKSSSLEFTIAMDPDRVNVEFVSSNEAPFI